MGAKSGAQFSGARGMPEPATPRSLLNGATEALEQSVADHARELAVDKRESAVKTLVTLMEKSSTPAATRRACARDILEYADRTKVGTPERGMRGRAGLTIQIVNLVSGDPTEEREINPKIHDALDRALAAAASDEMTTTDLVEGDEWEATEQWPVPDYAPPAD